MTYTEAATAKRGLGFDVLRGSPFAKGLAALGSKFNKLLDMHGDHYKSAVAQKQKLELKLAEESTRKEERLVPEGGEDL